MKYQIGDKVKARYDSWNARLGGVIGKTGEVVFVEECDGLLVAFEGWSAGHEGDPAAEAVLVESGAYDRFGYASMWYLGSHEVDLID